ncbi:MAG: protein translocase subunit SecF [Granulosicoccus sp.]|nr:protein translocase subunit SecF [Granulosicoccus sp.]
MRSLISDTNFNFMGRYRAFFMVSAAMLAVAILAIAIRGLNLGVDFTGGYTIEVGYEQPADLNAIRAALVQAQLPDSQVQAFGTSTEVLIRMAPAKGDGGSSAKVSDEVLRVLSESSDSAISMRRVEFVGPQVGEELREKGGLAMLTALFGIILYIWFRFEKKFSIGSVLALVHDVIITVGVFALFQIEFDLTILAALLAVIGYSLNDTIVVFDRIRENFRLMRTGTPEEVMNDSINQTLSRTVITSGTTLLVLFALLLFGGKIISGFALALIIGIVVGTYSSIFVASAAVLHLGVTREDLMPVEKEGADMDAMP